MVTTPIITFIGDANEPDVYVDVTDLPDPFTMNIPVGISNTHTVVEPNAGGGHDHAFTQPDDHLAVVPPFLALAYIIRGV